MQKTAEIAFAVAPSTPSTLYAGTDRGDVFRSTNDGESWSEFNPGALSTDVNAVGVDPLTPATIYAGTDRVGIFMNLHDNGN
jgi:hypothetical protein